jgi:predicted RNA-binding Zn ribbon-like protein
MTGESHPALRGRQPGGREPAPGRLGLVQAFINSNYDLEFEHGADLFATPSSLARWLARSGLGNSRRASLTERDVRRAVAVREGLRALAARNGERESPGPEPAPLDELNRAARGAAVEVRFSIGGDPLLVPGHGGVLDRALAVVFAAVAGAMLDGSWSRLKICPGEDCGWAFYDHSRNQSGRWCSMAVCGGRLKARAYYRRRRERRG